MAVRQRSWGNEFGDDFTAVSDEHALARAHLPHVFAQTVFEVSKAHGLHVGQCSFMSLHCQAERSVRPTALSNLESAAVQRGVRCWQRW